MEHFLIKILVLLQLLYHRYLVYLLDYIRLNVQLLINSGYQTHAIIPEALKHTNISKLFANVEFFNSFATLYDENLGNKIIKTLNQDVKSPWFLFVHLMDLHGPAIFHLGNNFEKSGENYTEVNQYDKMLSAIDPWLEKIFQCINLKNTICVITSDLIMVQLVLILQMKC